MCDCNDCLCHTDSVSFNRTCIYKDHLCSFFVSCAVCWPMMNCSIGDCHPSPLDYLNSDGISVSCTFERDGCTVDYQVVLSGAFNNMGSVFVGGERDCQDSDILGQLAWIIPVSISGGILLPGLLLLVAATCIRIHKCNNPICTSKFKELGSLRVVYS
ncbi:hypothetical protein GBAR_LOCUS30245 [Geodia barretti]|uniref:Uncharacterized protein n=1 Tax=Geodia barretti TaxID=519541 RepID=A0AA35TXA2_GEOBA|nr:hypothetical protein GBAR_LOCUS30245 [Geodia barretti]